MKISLLNPFTPKAAGVVEGMVAEYHNQPHLSAFRSLTNKGHQCSMEYLTSKYFKYEFDKKSLYWRFFPVNYKLNGDHKKWKKQYSTNCLKYYDSNTPDLTYINMSAHSSPFSHDLAKLILSKGKSYVPMLGGQHYSETLANKEYYKKANHIIVHTNLQKEEMESIEMFKGKKILVYPLGVDCNYFKPHKNIISSTSPKLLYVGRIVEWKRVHLAIEALNHLINNGFKDAHLNIIGPVSSDSYYDELKQFVSKNNIQNNVTFVGHLEHNYLPKYFSESNLFLLPSDKETFGMVMIEAMACGTPVAGINCPGGPADVIENNIDGVLCAVEEYSNRIVEYFKDKDLQIQMSANARKKVLDKYSLDITNEVILNSVKDIQNE